MRDRAETTLEVLRTRYEEKLDELEGAINTERESIAGLAARETQLRNDVLIPMLYYMSLLWQTALPQQGNNFSKLIHRLRAESALYELSRAATVEEFRVRRRDLEAYLDVLQQDRGKFHYLFQMALQNLETLFQEGRASREDKELREAEDWLRQYTVQDSE